MPTLSLGDLQGRVYARIDGNSLLYPPAEVVRAINEAIQILNLLTGFLRTSIIVPLWSQPNRVWYMVPKGIVIPTRVTFEGRTLGRYSMDAIGKAFPTWPKETTLTAGQSVTNWIPYGIDRFAIYPADAQGGGALTVTGVQEPIPLVATTDTVLFPNDVLGAFDFYASHVLTLKESPRTFSQTSGDYKAFLTAIKNITIWDTFKAPRFFIEELRQPQL